MSGDVPIDNAASTRPRARAYRITGGGMLVLCILIATFSYEVPLAYITSRYRLNPRAFDVAAALLLGYWLLLGSPRGWRWNLANPILKPWLALVAVFLAVTLATFPFVPWKVYIYSVWYALRHVLASLVLLTVLSAPLTEKQKRMLLWVALIGGAWVAFYGDLQLLGVFPTKRILPSGMEIATDERAITSTLGPSYYHAGQFGIISGLVGLALFRVSKGFPRLLALALTPFVMVPAIVSGSRAGFIGLIVALVFLGTREEYRRYFTSFAVGAVLAVVITIVYAGSFTEFRDEKGGTQSRVDRLFQGPRTIMLVQNDVGPRLWVMGGGFYVAPIAGHHRIGYGVHNIFLFPLEQSGLIGFGVSLWIWWRLWFYLRSGRRTRGENPTDRYLRVNMYGYLAALAVVGHGGQIFWLGFGNENLGTYQFLLFGLAMMRTDADDPKPAQEVAPAELTSPYLMAQDEESAPHPA